MGNLPERFCPFNSDCRVFFLVFWKRYVCSAGMIPAKTAPDQVSSSSETKEQEPLAPDTEKEEEKQTADTDGYEFILVNHDDYVTVYRLPENVVYEYTDVIMDVLPFELQEEIRDGKFLKTEEELYNFLENYTS